MKTRWKWKVEKQKAEKGKTDRGSKEGRPKTFHSEIFVLLIIFSCAVQDALATP